MQDKESDGSKKLAKMVAMALAKSHGHLWGHCDQRYFTGHAQAVFTAIKEAGMVIVPQSALDWLNGEGDDFEKPEGARGNFWWRTEFKRRAMITAGEE